MRAINFEGANIQLAESQEEYETLPIWMDVDENNQPIVLDNGMPRDPMGQAVHCMELNKEEIDEIVKTGKLWGIQSTFWHAFQPINMTTQNPFSQTQ